MSMHAADAEVAPRTIDRDGQPSAGAFRAEARPDLHDSHDEPTPEEPKTPLWLTAVGGGLFFLLAIVGLVDLASEPPPSAQPAASASASAPPPPPPKAPVAVPPAPPPPIVASAPPLPAAVPKGTKKPGAPKGAGAKTDKP